MSTFDRYQMPSQPDWEVPSEFETAFRWEYDDGQRDLLNLYPGNAAVLGNLGQTLLWTGRLDEAAACFAQASRINPVVLAQLVRARRLPAEPAVLTQMEGMAENPLLPEETRARIGAGVPFPSRLGEPAEYALLVASIVENPMLNGFTIRLDAGQRFKPE